MLPCLVDNKDNPSEISPTLRDVFTTQCTFRHIAQFCCIFDGTYAARPLYGRALKSLNFLLPTSKSKSPNNCLRGMKSAMMQETVLHTVCVRGEREGGDNGAGEAHRMGGGARINRPLA